MQQDRQGLLQGLQAEIALARVAVDPVEKGRKLNEFVAHFDELEIEKVLLARHIPTFAPCMRVVNREDKAMVYHAKKPKFSR